MNFSESIFLALTSLRSNKMRALLTLLGVIIGIAAVIAILTLGKALQASTAKDLENVGANDFIVQVEARSVGEDTGENAYVDPSDIDEQSKLNPEIIDALRNRFQNQIEGVGIGSYSSHRGTVSTLDETGSTTLQAVNSDFFAMKNSKAKVGRLLTEEDVDGDRQVAVVTSQIVHSLFHGDDRAALGAEIDFTSTDGRVASFVVVGVLADSETGGLINDPTLSTLYVPWPSESKLTGTEVTWTSVNVRPGKDMDKTQFKEKLQSYMDQVYDNDAYYRAKIIDFQKELAQLNNMLTTMSVAVSAIGGISLLVGGIGVMNIMLVTVTERTREIGIRKALGATRRAIRTQFVVEAMIIGLIGGLIGVTLGSVFGMLGANALKSFVYPPVGGILLSLIFSLAIGLFFGYYPANKAAKLDPIDALRYE